MRSRAGPTRSDKSGGASIAFVGDQTGQIGSWEPSVGENNKPALDGRHASRRPRRCPTNPAASDKVRWLDGTSIDVRRAVGRGRARRPGRRGDRQRAPDCRPLGSRGPAGDRPRRHVARPGERADLGLSRSPARAVKVTRVAVDQSVTVDPPPWNANNPPDGCRSTVATGTADSKKLTVSFIGAP